MAKAIHIASNTTGGASTANTTQYWNHIGGINPTATEADANHTIWQAGTYNNLRVGINTNSVAATSTFRTRKNTANGGQSVSVTSSGTGIFADTTNSDTIAANDLVCIQSVPGAATGTYTPKFYALDFAATTNTVTKLAWGNAAKNASTSFASPSTQYYEPLHGQMFTSGTATTTEANAQNVTQDSGTFKNLAVKITANGRANAQTFRLRKNGANANSTVSIGGAATGVIRDSTNTDTAAAGDKWVYNLATDSASTSFITTYAWWAVDFETTNNNSIYTNGNIGSAVQQAKASTAYFYIAGRLINTATETIVQLRITPSTVTFYNLSANITVNPLTGASTLTLRKNTANTSLAASIGIGATGVFVSTAGVTADTTTNDLVNLVLVTGSGGGTANITVTSTTVHATEGSAGTPIDMTPNLVTITNKIITKI